MTRGPERDTLMTVTGPIPGDSMGVTLPHEHLFNDLSGVIDEPFSTHTEFLAGRTVDSSIHWALRHDPYCCADNLAEKPVPDVSHEVREFAALGGGTIVDATGSAAIGRNPQRLLEVAHNTGTHVVMSTGPYLEKFEQERITARSIDDQATEMIHDITDGVADTGIRAGMIGEIGVSPTFTSAEQGGLRAAALAQQEVQTVGLNIHMPGWERFGDQVLDIVLDEVGVSPSKVSLAHSDPSGPDLAYQQRLLDRGIWLEFDMIGLDISFPMEGVSPSAQQTADAVAGLIEAGYGHQLVLSHDLFLKQMWTRHGGNGFVYVPGIFMDLLRQRGISDAQCTALLIENPRRLLTA